MKKLIYVLSFLIGTLSLLAGEIYTKTTFYSDVTVGTWTGVTNVTSTVYSNSVGKYTNGAVEVWYRVTGVDTVKQYRLPPSLVTSNIFTGSVTGNAVNITWEVKNGMNKYAVERSVDNSVWTNWAYVSNTQTNYIDYGTNVWTTTNSFTNLFSVFPAPSVPWGSGGGDLISTKNLSDLTSPAVARTNLGLGTASTNAESAFYSSSNPSNYISSYTESDPVWTGVSNSVPYLSKHNVFTSNQQFNGTISMLHGVASQPSIVITNTGDYRVALLDVNGGYSGWFSNNTYSVLLADAVAGYAVNAKAGGINSANGYFRGGTNLDLIYAPIDFSLTETQHGTLGGTNLHALADGSGAGFLSAVGYNKLAVAATNNGTVDHLYTTTSSGYAGTELVSADWVRSLVEIGVQWFMSSNTEVVGYAPLVACQGERMTAPVALFRSSVAITNTGVSYVHSMITTSLVTGTLSGPAAVKLYCGRYGTGNLSGQNMSISVELYYTADKTNLFGDWESTPQAIPLGAGATNIMMFSIPFPNTDVTNSLPLFRIKKSSSANTTNFFVLGGDATASFGQLREPSTETLGTRGATNTVIGGVDGTYDSVNRILTLPSVLVTNNASNISATTMNVGSITQTTANATNVLYGSLIITDGTTNNITSSEIDITKTQPFIRNRGTSGGIAGTAPAFIGMRSGGIGIATTNTSRLVSFIGSGYDTNWSVAASLIAMVADQDFTPTARGSHIEFHTTLTNTIALAEKMRFTHDGRLAINTNAAATTLDVNGATTIRGSLDMQGNAITNYLTTYDPSILSGTSNTVTLGGAKNYYSWTLTNTSTLYLAPCASNKMATARIDVDTFGKSFSINSGNCITQGLGNVLILTNAGNTIQSYLFDQCYHGTNATLKIGGYQLR